jgi:Tfp pilus assembly protein PilO
MTFNTPEIKNSYQRRNFTNPTLQAVLLAIILVLFSWFILRPKLSQTSETRSNLSTAQAKLKQTQADQNNLNQLVSKLRSSKDEVALVDEALPLSGRVSKAHLLMESLVQSSGMSLAQLNADTDQKVVSAGDKDSLDDPFKKTRSLRTIKLTASVTGTMDQFKNLLELIEKNSRLLDVDSVDIVGGDQSIRFRLVVKAYAYETAVVKAPAAGADKGATNEK